MAEVEKFMFDREFDAPPPVVAIEPEFVEEELPPPPPPPPTFSEAELEDARNQARGEGVAEGIRIGRSEVLESQGQIHNEILDHLSVRLSELVTEQTARYTQQREVSLQIALTIARRLLPSYIGRHGSDEIMAMVSAILRDLQEEPRLVIRLPEMHLDALTEQIEAEAAKRGFPGQLVFVGDAELGESDCKVEWADGGAERDASRLWSEIDRLAEQVLLSDPAPESSQD